MAPFARGKPGQIQRRHAIEQVNGDPDQAQGRQAHRGGHAPYLTIPAFAQFQLKPAGGHADSVADRRLPGG